MPTPARLFVFNSLTRAGPLSHSNPLFPSMHGHSTRFFPILQPLPTAPLFSPLFSPPRARQVLRLFRGVGSFTGIFSGGVQTGPVLDSR